MEKVLDVQPGFLFKNVVVDIVDKLNKRRNIEFLPEKNWVDLAGLLTCLRTKPMQRAFDLVYKTREHMNRELGILINISSIQKWYTEANLEKEKLN